MRIDPTLDEVINGPRGMKSGIRICLENQCLVSAISLMYSTVDAVSALSRKLDAKKTDKKVFMSWVDHYVLPPNAYGLTAEDLYAARCGVLHTYNAEFDAIGLPNARRLIYQWRSGPAAGIAMAVPINSVVVNVEDLWELIDNGISEFLIDAEIDQDLKRRVTVHLATLFCYVPSV